MDIEERGLAAGIKGTFDTLLGSLGEAGNVIDCKNETYKKRLIEVIVIVQEVIFN